MQIVELEWLRAHEDDLTEEDSRALHELGIFEILDTGKIDMPLPDVVHLLGELSRIVGKYMQPQQ